MIKPYKHLTFWTMYEGKPSQYIGFVIITQFAILLGSTDLLYFSLGFLYALYLVEKLIGKEHISGSRIGRWKHGI